MKTSPLVTVAERALAKNASLTAEDAPGDAVRAWAHGRTTLQEIKGYSDDELYLIAQHGYTLFLNGKIADARVIFEGLLAIDPRNDYYYRALGVIYHRLGDIERALRQFTHAITVAPHGSAGYVNRAEAHIARRDFARAQADLHEAVRVARDPLDPVARKAVALLSLIRGAG